MGEMTPTMPGVVFGRVLGAVLKRIRTLAGHRQPKMMHLCETLALGDRRFLALVTVEDQRFLVGGAGNSIALLAQLPPKKEQDEVSVAVDGGTTGT